MNRGEFNAECDGMTRIICTSVVVRGCGGLKATLTPTTYYVTLEQSDSKQRKPNNSKLIMSAPLAKASGGGSTELAGTERCPVGAGSLTAVLLPLVPTETDDADCVGAGPPVV